MRTIYLFLFLFLTLFIGFLFFNSINGNFVSSENNQEFGFVRVSGNSMFPLIENGEVLKYEKNPRIINRFDVVLINSTSRNSLLIKRVFGLPGDFFSYENNSIFINGDVLRNSIGDVYLIDSEVLKLYSRDYSLIPKNFYFVLGDSILDSYDSRSFGFVKRDYIVGKVLLNTTK